MKTLKILSLLMMVSFLISCGKDKDEDLIIGTWLAKSLVSTNCTDPADNQNYTFTNGCATISNSGLSFDICMKATFTEAGTYSIESKITFFGQTETTTETGTYTIANGKIKLCDSNGDCEEDTFDVSKTELTLNGKDADTGCNSVLKMGK